MASADKAKVVRRRAKRYDVVHNCAITAACDRWLRSRGLTAQRENFNKIEHNRGTKKRWASASVNASASFLACG
jgi:hypothetical protein